LRAAFAISTSARDAALLGWSLAALALWLVAVTTVELVRVIPVTIQGIGLWG